LKDAIGVETGSTSTARPSSSGTAISNRHPVPKSALRQ
jgi:hypothetical protein